MYRSSKSAVVAAIAAATCMAIALSGCSNNTTNSPSGTKTSSASQASNIPKVTGGYGANPTIAKPKGNPPTELVVKDLVVGKGTPVSDITKPYLWNYEGISWSDGKVFDSSFDRGAPIPFALNGVISGWTEGLQGIKPGGRRLLIVPPEKGYGAAGSPPAIGPNETLVFVVDLVGNAPSQ